MQRIKNYFQNKRNKFKVVLGSLLSITAIAIGLNALWSTEEAKIEINSEETFVGNSFTFSGKVEVGCICNINLELNGESIIADKNGYFEQEIKVNDGNDKWDYSLEATTIAKFSNNSTQKSVIEGEIKRSLTDINISAISKSLDSDTAVITIESVSGAEVTIVARTGYFAVDPYGDIDEDLAKETIRIDDSGKYEIDLPFKNTYNNRHMTYTATATSNGYAINEDSIEIKNLNLDEARMNEEKMAWQKEKEKEEIVNNMDVYTGDGSIQIAVGENIEKSRTVGYRYVLNPQNDHFIGLPLYVKNVGWSADYVSPNYFTIIDENGLVYTHDQASYSYGNYFDSVSLEPFTYTAGYLAYIVPKSHHYFTVVYNDGLNTVRKKIYVD